MKTIIAVPDFTRNAHLKKILPGLIKRLNGDIEIIIATGLHRPPTRKEIKVGLGLDKPRRLPFGQPTRLNKVKISVHNHGKNHVVYFGKTKKGIPVYLNKKLKNIDSIITVGVVEPHLYAGYSGGTKVAAIGLAGEKTINATHHPRFLDHPGTTLCSISGNPFRAFIEEVSNLLPITHSINIVNDENGDLKNVFEGKPGPCFRKAASYSKKLYEKKVRKGYDIVICNIPREKGENIYQASRAFNCVANTKKNILNKNSIILVKADLSEGFGKGLGEKRFMKTIIKMKDPRKLILKIKKKGCLAGEHRAYMVAKAMLKAKLGFISKRAYLYKNKGLPFLFFKNSGEAAKFIKKSFKKSAIYCLKNSFTTILVKNHN